MKGFHAKTTGTTIKTTKPIITGTTLGHLIKAKGALASEMHMRTMTENPNFNVVRPGIFDRIGAGSLSLGDMMSDRTIAASMATLANDPALYNVVKDRNLMHVVNDKKLMAKLNTTTATALNNLAKTSAIDRNFKHQMRGINNGQLIYAIKDKLNEFKLESGIKTSEMSSVETRDLGSATSVVKMVCNESKTVRLEINNKLGVGKDNLRIVIDKIPAAVGKDLNLNLKPGLGGLDILTVADKVNARVSVTGKIDGKVINNNYGVDIGRRATYPPSTMLSGDDLRVGKIENLFGQMLNSKLIKKS